MLLGVIKVAGDCEWLIRYRPVTEPISAKQAMMKINHQRALPERVGMPTTAFVSDITDFSKKTNINAQRWSAILSTESEIFWLTAAIAVIRVTSAHVNAVHAAFGHWLYTSLGITFATYIKPSESLRLWRATLPKMFGPLLDWSREERDDSNNQHSNKCEEGYDKTNTLAMIAFQYVLDSFTIFISRLLYTVLGECRIQR